jgi:hypothetical protein
MVREVEAHRVGRAMARRWEWTKAAAFDGGEVLMAVDLKLWVFLQLREDNREVRHCTMEDGLQGGRRSLRWDSDVGDMVLSGEGRQGPTSGGV